MGDPSEAVKRARGTTGSAGISERRLFTPDEERNLGKLVSDHATMRPQDFEAKYGQSWLSAAPKVQEAARLLTLHRLQEDRRIQDMERTQGTMDIDRDRQAAAELASFNRGVESFKASGPGGAILGAASVYVAADRGADIHELATIAETSTQAGDMAANLLAAGRGRAKAPPGSPSPGARGARRTSTATSPANKAAGARGTSPKERGVPPQPVVIDPGAQSVGNDNAVPWGQRRPGQQPVLVQTAEPLRATGTHGPKAPTVEGGPRAAGPTQGGRPRIIAAPAAPSGPRSIASAEAPPTQTRRAAPSRPDLLASYHENANQKIPELVDSVVARQRTTPTRRRLDVLGARFEHLMGEVGNSPQLTPLQRARAMEILREARALARGDFDGLRNSLNRALRRDQRLRDLERALRAAGDVSDAPGGGLRVRTRNDATQEVSYEPLNIEHRVRLSDNPWLYNNRDNLILTDGPQNQQYLEALRKYGKIWPTDPVEGFVVRHGLHDQPVDFRPGGR